MSDAVRHLSPPRLSDAAEMGTGGEVANALVCKTSIRGFNSRPVLHRISKIQPAQDSV